MQYREVYGPFNDVLRIERMIARVAAPLLGKKSEDLLTWPKEIEQEEEEASIEETFAMFRALATKNDRKS